MKVGIIAIGYNRPKAMQRLLRSLCGAQYFGDKVDLIVSIDKSDNQKDVLSIIENVTWNYGDYVICAQPERLGLRKHVIQCGDFCEQYDAIVMFEDDIVASPFYYSYIKQVIDYYKDDERIGGISLYKHETHPGVFRPFIPHYNGYDIFLMQFAQSWGQCWTKKMWRGFKRWYIKNKEKNLGEDGALPEYIASWNEQSWLKYCMRYLVETNKYFIYPMISLSTNGSDTGEHNVISNNDFQVAMLCEDMKFRLPMFESAVRYDVFMERVGVEKEIFPELQGKKVLDLYGIRRVYGNADYVISTRGLPYKKIKSIQMKYRPIEQNCFCQEEGLGINIYDIKTPGIKARENLNIITRYDVRAISWKRMLRLCLAEFKEAFLLKFRRLRMKH